MLVSGVGDPAAETDVEPGVVLGVVYTPVPDGLSADVAEVSDEDVPVPVFDAPALVADSPVLVAEVCTEVEAVPPVCVVEAPMTVVVSPVLVGDACCDV